VKLKGMRKQSWPVSSTASAFTLRDRRKLTTVLVRTVGFLVSIKTGAEFFQNHY
jgi:hypothetical protein